MNVENPHQIKYVFPLICKPLALIGDMAVFNKLLVVGIAVCLGCRDSHDIGVRAVTAWVGGCGAFS